jgi:Holliday junction resolvasome RuvABC DNA-binding subunit
MSSESTGTGKESARDPPPCLNTKKCAGETHYLSDCPQTGKDEAMVLLPEYKKKWEANKKEASFKTLGNNIATTENMDVQTAYLTAENLGVKVTVLADTGSEYSALPRSDVEDSSSVAFFSSARCCRSPSC